MKGEVTCSQVMQPEMMLPLLKTENIERVQIRGGFGHAEFDTEIQTKRKMSQVGHI